MKNFFNKLFSQNSSYIPSSPLEELLATWAPDPSRKPEIYQQLLSTELFILGKPGEGGSVNFMINEQRGERCTFAFTSLKAIEWVSKKSGQQFPYIAMNAADFLPLIVQSDLALFLNVEMDIGLMFTSNELGLLVSGGNPQGRVIKEGSKLTFSRPEIFPTDLLQKLKEFIPNKQGLEDIYFGLQQVEHQVSYVLALKINPYANVKIQDLVNEIGVLIRNSQIDRPVDMTMANEMYEKAFKEGILISIKTNH